MKDAKFCVCRKCSHRWASRIKNPHVCPSCHSPTWREKRSAKN